MYTITINHKDIKLGTRIYSIYTKDEAIAKKIDFKPWHLAEQGEYGLTDDNYVAQVIKRKKYMGSNTINTYLKYPFGYTIFNDKYNKKLFCGGRRSNHTFSGKSTVEVDLNKAKGRNLAMLAAQMHDLDYAIDLILGPHNYSQHRKWKRYTKTEVFKKMVREELQKLLTDRGFSEGDTLDLLQEAIDFARSQKNPANLLRAVENLIDIHGMKDKNKIKTTEQIEGSQTTKLLDEIDAEETNRIKLTRIIEKDEDGNRISVKEEAVATETQE